MQLAQLIVKIYFKFNWKYIYKIAINCLSCVSPRFFESNTCLTTCISGKYGDQTDRVCKSCHSSCKECSGATNTNCTQCIDGKFLLNG